MSSVDFSNVVTILSDGQKELRDDMKELTSSVNTLVKTQTESITEHRHTRKAVVDMRDDLEKFKDGIAPRVRQLEISKEQNKLRWWFLGVTVTAIVSLIAFFATTVVRPFMDSTAQNETVLNAVNAQTNVTNQVQQSMSTIEQIMIKNYSKREAEKVLDELERGD